MNLPEDGADSGEAVPPVDCGTSFLGVAEDGVESFETIACGLSGDGSGFSFEASALAPSACTLRAP